MSNPTDTNQASEDELEHKLMSLFARSAEFGRVFLTSATKEEFAESISAGALDHQGAAHEAMKLIRTEKLKLLAEVRERVVVEDRKEHSPYCGIGCPHDELIDLYRCTCGLIGSPRNKQLEALTKLEAEL